VYSFFSQVINIENLQSLLDQVSNHSSLARKSLNLVIGATAYINQRFAIVPEECFERGIKISPDYKLGTHTGRKLFQRMTEHCLTLTLRRSTTI